MWGVVLVVWVVSLCLPTDQRPRTLGEVHWEAPREVWNRADQALQFDKIPEVVLSLFLLFLGWSFPLLPVFSLCTWRLHWGVVVVAILNFTSALGLLLFSIFSGPGTRNLPYPLYVWLCAYLLSAVTTIALELKRRKLLSDLAESDFDNE